MQLFFPFSTVNGFTAGIRGKSIIHFLWHNLYKLETQKRDTTETQKREREESWELVGVADQEKGAWGVDYLKQSEAFGKLALYTASPVSFVFACVLQQKFDHGSTYLVAISTLLCCRFLFGFFQFFCRWFGFGLSWVATLKRRGVCVSLSLLLACLLLRWVVCCSSESVHSLAHSQTLPAWYRAESLWCSPAIKLHMWWWKFSDCDCRI
jgi:hypothetical protein